MQKTIVTHFSPDLDGAPGIWMLKRFHPDFKSAKVAFVPAGDNTLHDEPVDSNPNVVHVDVGGGRFDHHHTNDFTCGVKLVWQWLVSEGYIAKEDAAMERIVQVLTELDHAWETYKWPEPASDRWEFSLNNILGGFKMMYPKQDERYVEKILEAMDAIYKNMQLKVKAEEEIKQGEKFKTKWGEGVAIYTANDAIIDAGIKGGFVMVARKDPGRGYLRVTASNSYSVDLTEAYNKLRQKDPEATWFLHASKKLLRNGSTRNPTMVPTKLELAEIIEVLKKS